MCLLTALAYSNSFPAGLVFDNKVLLLEDRRVREVTSENIKLILHRSYWWPYTESALYRPVTTLSYLFNHAVLGNQDRPAGYHWLNLLLHVGNVLLVFAIALRLGRAFWPAVFLSAIWAVHPLSTEAVTNIVGRADLLAAMAVLCGLLAYLRAAEATGWRRWAWLAAVMAATTVGVFSKESAVAILGVILLYDVTFRIPATPVRRLVAGWCAILLPLLALWYQRSIVLTASRGAEFPVVDNPIIGADFWTGRLTALAVMPRYLWLMVWPLNLSCDYSYDQIPLASGRVGDWISWFVVAAAAAILVVLSRRDRIGFFAAAGAFVCFVPASNLLFVTGTIMAERLVYLASAGVIACGVMAAYAGGRAIKLQQWVSVALCIVVVLFAARTWARNRDWRSDLSLWTAAAQTSPRSFKTHGALAEALYNADPTHANLDRVIAEKERSLALLASAPDPVHVSLPYREAATYYLEYGEWLQQHDSSPAAREHATESYRKSTSAALHYLSLVGSERSGPVGSGADTDENRSRLTKDEADGYRLLSTAYLRLADVEKAIEAARRAQALEPFDPMSYRTTAAALLDRRSYDEAAVALLSGFMLTGNSELRAASVDLYRSGLDSKGCAVTSTAAGFVLNSSCDIVRQHMCAASRDAAEVQRLHGRPDLAQGFETLAAREFGCASGSIAPRGARQDN